MSNQTQAQAGYQPQHLRTAQLYDSSMGGTIIDGGIPMEGTIVGGDMGMTDMGMPVASAPMQYATPVGGSCGPGCGGGCGSCGGGPIGTSFVDTGAVYDGGVVQECGTCFDQGSVCDPCFDRGGCPPGQPCWLSGLSQLLRNGEYFAGATGFQGPGFSVGTNPASQVDDCNFGFYEGFNIGLPLCQLTCGLFSGQIGARAVQSNFNGTSFTPDQRDQLFVTAGLFRRVDQGFQFGVVYDYLDDQWFTNSTVGQVRGDLGWVFGNGKTLGFRFADNVEDDVSGGTVSGSTFAGLTTSTEQWYRVYLRGTSPVGGWGEVFGGGSSDYGIVGFNGDLPLSNMIAMQSGFTYYIGDGNGTGGADADAWNMYLGLSIRPRGFGWYNHYDTPLLPVADNGTMLLSR